jgi:hypothetical protein
MTTQPSAQRSRPRRAGAIGRAGHLVMVLAMLASTLAVIAMTATPARAAGTATVEDPAVVIPGGVNQTELTITISGTEKAPSVLFSRGTHPVNTATNQSMTLSSEYQEIGSSGVQVKGVHQGSSSYNFNVAQSSATRGGYVLISQIPNLVAPASITYRFPPGSLTFASTGPWTVQLDDGSFASSPTNITTVNLTEPPALPTRLVITRQTPGSVKSGAIFSPSPQVEFRDADNNIVETATDSVVATIVSGPAGATLKGGTPTATATAVNGVATFDDLSIDGPVGEYTLEFSSGSLTPATSMSFTLTVGAASAATSVISAGSATSQAGGSWQSVVTVQLKDSGGNPVTSGAGMFALSTDLGALSDVTEVGNGSYTAVLTSSVSGPATVTGTINGAAMTPASVTFTVGSTAQTPPLTVTSTSGTFVGNSPALALTVSGGSGIGVVSFTVVPGGTASGCSVSGETLTATSAGTCLVTATKAGDSQFAAQSSLEATVTLRRALTITGGSPGVDFGSSFTPTALVTAGSLVGIQEVDSALTKYTFAGTQGTVYGPSSEPPVDAGTYSVLPFDLVITGGSVSDYDITYVAGTLVISRVARTVAFTSAASVAVQYGDTTTVVAAPSVGDGMFVYAVSSTSDACTVAAASGVVTVTSASGTCEVQATVTGGTNHLDATTASSVTVTVSARPITVTAADRTVTFGTAVVSGFSVTTGSLAGTDRISAVTFTYEGTGSTTYASSTTAPTAIGTYSVTPSVAAFGSGSSADYTIVYAAGALSIVAPPPPPPPAPADGESDDVVGGSSSDDSSSGGGSGASNAGGTGTSGASTASDTGGSGRTDVRPGSSVDPDAPAGATVGGEPVDLVVAPGGSGGLSYTAGSVRLDLRTDPSAGGSVRSGTSSGSPELVIPNGETLSVSGGGLAPGSSVQLWSPGDGSQPTELARVTVRADGTFVFDLGVGSGTSQMPIGRQVLEIVGFDEDGNQVVVTMTVEVTQGEPAPEADRSTGGRPVLAAGQFSATSGGITEAVSMTGLDGRMGMTVEGEGWTVTVEVVRGDGAALSTGANTVLRLDRLSVGTATGVGFLPGTLVTVWMFSEPVRLATVTVDGDGGFTLEFLVDATTIAPGEHTLQVQGVGQDGLIKAVNLGVVVEPLEAVIVDVARDGAPWNGRPLVWWFLAVLLLGVAGAGVATRARATRA